MSDERGKSRRTKETNSSAYNKLRRELLKCPLCPPNAGENTKCRKKHGVKKKKKNR